MARRLGLLGPILVLVGAAIAVVAAWYVIRARPEAGPVIDTFVVDDKRSFVVRSEQGGERSFLEMLRGGDVVWQALIPHYAGAPGRPAIAWSADAVTVRVERNGSAEVFAFLLKTAAKLGAFRLAQDKEPIRVQPTGPITLTDHVRSFELVGGSDWNRLIAIDLRTGDAIWAVELGQTPIRAGGTGAGLVWLEQGDARRHFEVATGREAPPRSTN